ncbi:MAG: hypothetical protein ABEI86_05600, partial [Halobacteriaceae archaeon]
MTTVVTSTFALPVINESDRFTFWTIDIVLPFILVTTLAHSVIIKKRNCLVTRDAIDLFHPKIIHNVGLVVSVRTRCLVVLFYFILDRIFD